MADAYQDQTPNSDLRSLDRLVGTWNVSGGAEGKVTYEWLEGGFFLLQRYDLKVEQHRVKGKGTFSRDGRTCAGHGSIQAAADTSRMCPAPSDDRDRRPEVTGIWASFRTK
jgi:hypothetical protein